MMTTVWETESVGTEVMPMHLEKYVKASDFLKSLLQGDLGPNTSITEVRAVLGRFLLEMHSLLDIEEVLKTLMKFKVTHLIFDAIDHPLMPEASR